MSYIGDSTTWLRAIALDGTILGDAHLPPDSRILSADQQYLIVSYADDAGEPHVAVLEIRARHQASLP